MAEFWRQIKPRRQAGLISRFMRDLESGCFEMPRGFDVLTKYRTTELRLRHPNPPRLVPPEVKPLLQFYQRYPEAKLEPVALNSFKPPLAKQFALRQLQLLRDENARRVVAREPPLTGQQAFQMVEVEMAQDLERVRQRELVVTNIALVQRQEEEQLRGALQEVMDGAERPVAPQRRSGRRSATDESS